MNKKTTTLAFTPRSLSAVKPLAQKQTELSPTEVSNKEASPWAKSILEAMVGNGPKPTYNGTGSVLIFPSIGESKRLPFDPYNRPRRVFRSGNSNKAVTTSNDWLIEKLRQKPKLQQKRSESSNNIITTEDIFPEVGVFDERSQLEEIVSKATLSQKQPEKATKAKSKLFKKPVEPLNKPEEVDVFELIAGRKLEEGESSKEESKEESGGLFGFSSALPKLSRLEDEKRAALDDIYNLSDKEDQPQHSLDFEYDAGDDDELITTQAGDEEGDSRKKRRAKEASEVKAVERMMKTKYNMDL